MAAGVRLRDGFFRAITCIFIACLQLTGMYALTLLTFVLKLDLCSRKAHSCCVLFERRKHSWSGDVYIRITLCYQLYWWECVYCFHHVYHSTHGRAGEFRYKYHHQDSQHCCWDLYLDCGLHSSSQHLFTGKLVPVMCKIALLVIFASYNN